MDLKGKRFVNANGKVSVVKDTFENITIFEDGTRVDTRLLTNSDYYTLMPSGPKANVPNVLKQPMYEQINADRDVVDPKSFLTQKPTWATSIREITPQEHLMEQKAINTEVYNIDNTGMVTNFDVDAEKEEILRRNRHVLEQRDIEVAKQANQFKNSNRGTVAKILEEEEGIKIENINLPSKEEIYQEQIARGTSAVQLDPVMNNGNNMTSNSFMDPVIGLFKRAKMNTDFKFTLDVNKKIPSIYNIKMLEESYDTSIIEYLATEITEDLLRNPSQIKLKIEEELRRFIEPKKVIKKKEEPKVAKPTNRKRILPEVPVKDTLQEGVEKKDK